LFAESVNVRPLLFFTLPAAIGAKATSTVQVAEAAIEGSQLSLVSMKGGETTTLVTVTASVLDLLVTITLLGALVRVTISSPKLSFFSEKDSFGGLILESGTSDCAIAGRANADIRNRNDKPRPAIDPIHDLKRIVDRSLRSAAVAKVNRH